MDDETQVTGSTEAPVATETAAAPTNEADVQVNTETPEASQEVKESDVNATETVEEKLYAGKYKSAEELEKAYLSAQSEASKMASEKAELSRILADAFSAETAPVTSQPQVADEFDEFQQVQTPSNQGNDPVMQKLALMEFSMAHPDADGAAMVKIIQTDPAIKDITSYEAKLRYAHAVSQAQKQPKAVEQAQKQAAVQAQAKIAEKQAAQVESTSKQAPAPNSNEPLTPQQIRDTARDNQAFAEMMKKYPGIAGMMG